MLLNVISNIGWEEWKKKNVENTNFVDKKRKKKSSPFLSFPFLLLLFIIKILLVVLYIFGEVKGALELLVLFDNASLRT
jgi:hypothetical protein